MNGRWTARTLLACISLTAACGGGAAPAGPRLAVTNPPANAATDADAVLVEGTAEDDAAVVALTVGGVPATSSDGFATWRATVPLVRGTTQVAIDALDAQGRQTRVVHPLRKVDPLFSTPAHIDYDAAHDRAWILDRDGRVIELDPETGARTRVDRGGVDWIRPRPPISYIIGDLPPLFPPVGVAGNPDRGVVWVTQEMWVVRVDLATGERTEYVKGGGGGIHPLVGLQNGRQAVYDTAADRLLVCDSVRRGLVAIDFATRQQTVIAEGINLTGLHQAIAFDTTTREVYAVSSTVRAIDVDTGAIRVVSAPGTGPDIPDDAPAAALGPDGRVLYVVDPGAPAIVAVDVVTGARAVLDGPGVALVAPRGVACDTRRNRLLVTDAALDAVVAIPLAGGERTRLTGMTLGEGPSLDDVVDVKYDAQGRLLALRERGDVLLFGDDEQARAVAIVFDRAATPSCLAPGPDSNRIWVAEKDPAGVIALDFARVDLRVVSDAATGSGALFGEPRDLAWADGGLVLLEVDLGAASTGLWRVDPGTGAREDLTPAAPPLWWDSRMVEDPASGGVLVSSGYEVVNAGSSSAELHEVDPGTGDAVLLAGYKYASRGLLALDAEGRRAFLVAPGLVTVIDLATDVREQILLDGVPILDPVAVTYDARHDRLVIADSAWEALLAVPAGGGSCVFLAR